MSLDAGAQSSPSATQQGTAATTAKFSLSLGSSRKSNSSVQARGKRPHTALEEDAPDPEEDNHQEIATFGIGAEPPKKAQRVIKSVPDADWKEAARSKRQKSGLPSDAKPTNGTFKDNEIVQEGLSQGGLTVVNRSVSLASPAPEQATNGDVHTAAPRTADEEALDALVGNRKPDARIIVANSEEEAFQNSYDSAPPAPTIHDFTATPVEGFGAAILRGYLRAGATLEDHGYDENAESSQAKRRPAGLGLGAKESGMGFELGAWGRAARNQKGEGYIPVALKNSKTGEILTEDELKIKLEEQKNKEKNEKLIGDKNKRIEPRQDRNGEGGRKALEYREDPSSRRRRDEHGNDRRRDRRRDYQEEKDDHGDDRRRERRRDYDEEKDERDEDRRRRHDRDRHRDHRERVTDGSPDRKRYHGIHRDDYDRDRHRRRDRSVHGRDDRRGHHSSRK